MISLKNKKSSFILVPLLIIVWGFIVMKFINLRDGTEQIQPTTRPNGQKFKSIQTDSISLNLSYRDPFLSGLDENYQEEVNIDYTYITPKKNNYKLLYLGLVKNTTNGLTYLNFKVDNDFLTLRRGEEMNGMKVLEVFKDSVKVFYKDESVYLKLYGNAK